MKATLEDLKRELWLRNRNAGSIVWTTKDGKEIPINEMSDEHLLNTINMIMRVRNYQERDQQYYDWFWENLTD